MIAFAQRITTSDAFRSVITTVIVANAFGLTLAAVPSLEHGWHDALEWGFTASQLLFVVEIALRFAADGGSPRRFFASGWNRFDTAIVVLSLAPVSGAWAPLGRLLRVIRVARIFSTFEAISVPAGGGAARAVGPFALWWATLLWIAALAGHALFQDLDPSRWADLPRAVHTVFYLSVLSEVSSTVAPVTAASSAYLAYFVAFYLGIAAVALQSIRVATDRSAP